MLQSSDWSQTQEQKKNWHVLSKKNEKKTKTKNHVQAADNVSGFQTDLKNIKVQPARLELENNDRNQRTFKSWQAKLFTSNKLQAQL